MTIWRQNKVRKNQAVDLESFDVFSSSNDPFERDDDLALNFDQSLGFVGIQDTKKHRDASKAPAAAVSVKRGGRAILMYGALALGLAAAGFVVAKTKPWTYWSQQELVYAYFEVRAVDQSGRPVAGAVVKNAGKKVGTTDSFGEWRRYMRVPLGSTVPVTIAKNSHGNVLYATKNFAVPPVKPEKMDMELRASVQMLNATAEQKSIASSTQAAPNTTSTTDATQSAQAKAVSDDTLVSVSSDGKAVETSLEQSSSAAVNAVAAELPSKPTVVADSISGNFVSSHDSVWFEAMGSSSSSLSKDILPALVKRSKELGLRIDPKAEWRVRLTSLLDRSAVMGADGGGLIMVSSFDPGQTTSREFLRNYQSDALITARGILYVLSHQVSKNVNVARAGERWVATLPRSSPELWKLAQGMSFSNGKGQVWVAGNEGYQDGQNYGYYLSIPKSSDGPCGAGGNGCELNFRSFVEVPPVPNWIKIRAKAPVHLKDQIKIFVSGYEARPISDNLVEYWGQDRAKVNVTVVQAGRVLHRTQIVNDTKNPAAIAIGAGSLSRR